MEGEVVYLQRASIFGAICFVALMMGLERASAQNSNEQVYHLLTMYQHPWFWDVLGASVVGWVVGMVKGFSGSKDWLQQYWKTPPGLVIFLLDCFVFAGVGSVFGTGIYNPTSFLAAIAAGFTWPIGLGSLATKVGP